MALKVSEIEQTVRRTSIHLADKEMLRGTTPDVLLSGIGRRIRGSAGGIGGIAESADDAYKKSFRVEHLDIFLSHSWQTWWVMKYLTLLFYFNAVPAITTTSLIGLVNLLDERNRIVRPNCQVVGFVTFVATLLSWHHIVAALGIAKTMFLDKVCIHQTDATLKIQGIKSIGAILANSKMMLVAWDNSYFERLWCTYEMSAFRKGNPTGRIKVLPVFLGLFILAYTLATFIAEVMIIGVAKLEGRRNNIAMAVLIHFPMFVLCTTVMVRYIENLKQLKIQLANFSVRQAKCFCCDAKHIHPDTGAQLPCDREVVNNSIQEWIGLDTFDQMVRGDFKHFVKRTLGGRAKIPYRYVVAASIYPGLVNSDQLIVNSNMVLPMKMLFLTEPSCLRHPMIVAIMMAFHDHYQSAIQETVTCVRERLRLPETVAMWALYIVSGMGFSVLYWITLELETYVVTHKSPLLQVAWLLLEALCVVMAYFGRVVFFDPTQLVLWNTTPAYPEEGVRGAFQGWSRPSQRQTLELGYLGGVGSRLTDSRSTVGGKGVGRLPTL